MRSMDPTVRRIGLLGASFLVLSIGCLVSSVGCSGPKNAGDKLTGAGSTFVAPMMAKWASEYGNAKQVEINYTKGGSGAGIAQMTDQTIDFGCTDAPMSPDQLKKAQEKGGDVIHIPLVCGAVVPIYNLPGLKDPLIFSGEVLAGIYSAGITSWNDAKIKELNPNVELPDKKITFVHRSDPSGTTYIFTDFLSKASKDWSEKHPGGGNIEIKWTGDNQAGEQGNDGIAKFVKEHEGAIGYVEELYASKNSIAFGAVRNQSGKPVKASVEGVTAAAAALKEVPDNLIISLNNLSGDDVYPICGVVYGVAYVKQKDPAKAKALAAFFLWATHDGQASTAELHYGKIPSAVADKISAKLDLLK